jgi:hypothetical protein
MNLLKVFNWLEFITLLSPVKLLITHIAHFYSVNSKICETIYKEINGFILFMQFMLE